jgi:hypothetical protein
LGSRCRPNYVPICTNFGIGWCGTSCVFIEKRETSGREESPHNYRAAGKQAFLDTDISPHWLRHAHASHALDHGAPIPLGAGHPSVRSLATTTSNIHARPGDASAQVYKKGESAAKLQALARIIVLWAGFTDARVPFWSHFS